MAMPDKALNRCHILVTRPSHQAENLCSLIEQSGGQSYAFPSIETVPTDQPKALLDRLDTLKLQDIALFISANAVDFLFDHFLLPENWPVQTKIGAVGKSTVKALDRHGLIADIFPAEQFNSEALLALPEMHNVEKKHIMIFRGSGGRETLAQTLIARGAHLAYANCYQRRIPTHVDMTVFSRWAQQKHKISITTSNEGLENLAAIVGPENCKTLYNTPMVVLSERAALLARQTGFIADILVARQASDEAILEALQIACANFS